MARFGITDSLAILVIGLAVCSCSSAGDNDTSVQMGNMPEETSDSKDTPTIGEAATATEGQAETETE